MIKYEKLEQLLRINALIRTDLKAKKFKSEQSLGGGFHTSDLETYQGFRSAIRKGTQVRF